MAEEFVLSIFRGDAEGGEEVEYHVPRIEGMVVLDAVHHVQAHDAQDLAVRWNCKAAHCGSCSAEINGMPKLMCKTRLDEYQGETVHIQPMRTFPIIKDLVTDVSWNYEVAKKIPAFNPGVAAPFHMQQWDVDRIQEFHHCIECFLCQDVCHVLRDHHEQDEYYGPRFMVKMAEFEMHPMDRADRLSGIVDTSTALDVMSPASRPVEARLTMSTPTPPSGISATGGCASPSGRSPSRR
jgi:succinate dehydrogenase / fumarate reductase iron-sulfur subunit